MDKAKIAFLKCSVSRGMFPDEYAVASQAWPKATFSLFVPKDLVTLSPSDMKAIESQQTREGFLQVILIDQENGNSLIYLPDSPLEDFTRSVTVESSSVLDRPPGP